MNRESQNKTVRSHLRRRHPISQRTAAYKYDIFRLSGRIYDLRQEGLPIVTVMVKRGRKRYASYRLAA